MFVHPNVGCTNITSLMSIQAYIVVSWMSMNFVYGLACVCVYACVHVCVCVVSL